MGHTKVRCKAPLRADDEGAPFGGGNGGGFGGESGGADFGASDNLGASNDNLPVSAVGGGAEGSWGAEAGGGDTAW